MQVQIPHLRETPTSKQLVVNGEPFLMCAGELQNSSFTSSKYMAEAWPRLAEANLNTVLGSVTWEQIEPEEDRFDFSELDECLRGARQHDLKLVLLWFGSFKNGISTYAPAWVKTNTKRFPRARLRKAGGELAIGDVLSIFHSEAQKADAKAFGKLMAHLKEVDEKYSTVIMVQVENETGLLGDSRDGGAAAEKRFHSAVPSELTKALMADKDVLRPELQWTVERVSKNSTGTWPEVFGQSKRTDELFMAYHYALYLEQVARAGKQEFPLPLYTNVWQNYNDSSDTDNNFPVVVGGGSNPGDYPSGGGVINVLDVWQAFAPSLDMIAPDVYLNDYSSSCAKYRHRNQPLFIPEQRRDEYGARRIWAAVGSYQCLGASPFGIETLEIAENPFKKHYGLMRSVSRLILRSQRGRTSFGFFFDELPPGPDARDPSPVQKVKFGPWDLTIERSFVFGHPGPGFGMVIHRGGARFLLVGAGFQVRFEHETGAFTGILRFEEKEARGDGLETLRMLNGDETRSGAFCIMPNEEPDYGGFPICVTIPARTMLAEAEVYALEDEGEEA